MALFFPTDVTELINNPRQLKVAIVVCIVTAMFFYYIHWNENVNA